MNQEKMTRFVRTEDVNKNWYVIDAKDQVLGRIAGKIAHILRGKHKPTFTPNTDTGDFVIVINADKIKLTGKRESQKTYFTHTGYPGGVKVKTFAELRETKPEFIIQQAVKGMLPKNKLGRRLNRKLKVYAGENHPHQAQQPETLSL